MKIQRKVLTWRAKQVRGSIMKPSTFKAIERKAMKKYHIGKARAAKIAGKAYYTTLKYKFKEKH